MIDHYLERCGILKSIENSIETLHALSKNKPNEVIKKKDFIPKSKNTKNKFEQKGEDSFIFYKQPNEKDILM